MLKSPFSKKEQEIEQGSIEWMIQEAKRLGYVYADNGFLSWVDVRIGKGVGDLFRSCIVHTRQWMIRNGLPVGKIRLDDMISYVFMGIKRSSSGKMADDSFAKTITTFRRSASFSKWASDAKKKAKSTKNTLKFSLANSTNTFKKWFKGSKAVNEDGEPCKLYLEKNSDNPVFKDMAWGSAKPGYNVDSNPKNDPANTTPIYMSIKNPFDADKLRSKLRPVEFFDELAIQSSRSDKEELAKLLSQAMESAKIKGSGPHYSPSDFWSNTKSLFGNEGAEAIRKAFEITEFDGITYQEHGVSRFCAFSSSQIVSASSPELLADNEDAEKELVQTNSQEFADFFKNSKVTEEDGTPKMVYHGTDKSFSVFNTDRGGWFITDPVEATTYGSDGPVTNVISAYLSIENPYISSHAEKSQIGTDRLLLKAKRLGHDGVKLPADPEMAKSFIYDEAYHDVWIALSPNQIKSATNNNGDFNPEKPDIYFSKNPNKGNPYFKRWFSGSKVVNRKGEPLVVFHGTDQDFNSFDKKKIGSNFTYDEKGFFFTSSPKEASDYAIDNTVGLNEKKQNGNVMPVYLSIKNPLIIDPSFLKSMGMGGLLGEDGTEDTITFWDTYQTLILEWVEEQKSDGVIIVDPSFKEVDGEPRRMVVAFEPEQIKSAIGNNGQYNPFKPDIRFSKSGIRKANQDPCVSYPLAEPGTRYKEADKDTVWMSPNEYLSCVRPLTLDKESRASISSLVEHILSGRKLDPLVIYADGSEDGCHCAYAAIELGIEKVPVVDYRVPEISLNKHFDDWFEDSKIVDEHGAPLIVYHGTMSDFSEFSTDFFGEGDGNADFGEGFYFTNQPEAANTYADGEGGNVIPVYLRINNPAKNDVMLSSRIQNVVDDGMGFEDLSEVLEEMGYDGVEFTHSDGNKEYVVFDASQIKSALGNNGLYSKHENDIRFSRSGQSTNNEDGVIVDKNGALRVVYHGTPETVVTQAVYSNGSDIAVEELKAIAQEHKIGDWTSVPRVFERWVSSGIAEARGINANDALHVRDLFEQTKSKKISNSKIELGFDQFDMPSDGKELGVHFGTKKQAETFGYAFPFHVIMKNPIRMPDLGTWHYQSVMRELRRQGIQISDEEYETVFNARDNNQSLRDLMLSKGIDGVIYKNEAEGKGDSYIAINNEQIHRVKEPEQEYAFSKNSNVKTYNDKMLTESQLIIEVAKTFPRLTAAAQTILERGREGKPGGAVIIDSNKAERIAEIVSERTGRQYQACLQAFTTDEGEIHGFYEANIKTSFIVGKGMTPEKGVSILFHELAHDQQIDRINLAAKELMNNKHNESESVRDFLGRVEQRLIDTNESKNHSEILPYIIEQAIMESFVSRCNERNMEENINYQELAI